MDALNDIRSDIDNIDRQLIRLLAQRQILVEKAGRLSPKEISPQSGRMIVLLKS